MYSYINAQSKRIREEINSFCRQNNISAQAIGEGSIFYTHFVTGKINRTRDLLGTNLKDQRRFFLHLLKKGVFIPFMHLGMISFAHTEEDVQFVIDAHLRALEEVKQETLGR